MATITQLDLFLAQGKTGSFTAPAAASTSTIAVFTTSSSNPTLGDVGEAYKLTSVGGDITYINGGNTTHGWNIDASTATAVATIKGGDYNDTIKVADKDTTVITGLGKDVVDLTGVSSKKVTLTDYSYDSDVIKVGATIANTAITSAGLISASSTGIAQLNATSGYYKAVIEGTDKTVRYWKGGTSAQRIDGSAETKELYMVGGDSSDTLVGGSKADTILTGSIEGAYAIGGAGDDSIVLGDNGSSAADALRQFVEISTSSGKDEVTYFSTGFADTNDVLVLSDGAIEDAKFTVDTTGLAVKSGSGQASIAGTHATGDNVVLMMKAGSADAAKVAVVNAASTTGYAPATADSLAGYYVSTGKVGYVNLSGISDDVVVELSNAGNYEDNATFKGIDSVTGGMGNTTLVGDGNVKNYIAAGTGNTTLWGGGGSNDTLKGNSSGAANAFFVAQYDGKDTIQNFKAGVSAETADVLYMLNSPATGLKNDGQNTTFTYADGSSAVLAGKTNSSAKRSDDALRFTLDGATIQTAVIGKSTAANSFTYSSDVTSFYFGKNNGEDLIVASDSDDKVVFYDFANTDLTAIDTTGSQLKFTFNDGSSLQVQNYTTESVQIFEFNNSSWIYSRETKSFTQTK